ncbi:hypothetical protein FSP39_003872 [Pinctada imbricata]|uniref:Uncharacterized protein n=1 Tax=Pinctada imbricata TaxID=66713 RepID=A0AA88XYQ2_PINIB|nr:hypothetical protein FSP39_003872 [Pinctada imbricata]
MSPFLSLDNQYRYNELAELLYPVVNAYGGTVGERTILRCRVKTDEAPEINWYKKALENTPCSMRHTQFRTAEGLFCLEDRSRSHIRQRRHVSKLIFEKPTLQDSGSYMCVVSFGSRNITQFTKVTFNELSIPPVRLVDSTRGNIGEGRVEIYYNKTWSRVQMLTWESPEASLICRLLGYRDVEFTRTAYAHCPHFLVSKVRYTYLQCTHNVRVVLLIEFIDSTQIGRSETYVCTKTATSCQRVPKSTRRPYWTHKVIRFAATSLIEGRIEVYGNGYWGTVCLNGLTDNEISTICNTFGFRFGGIMHNAWDKFHFGQTDVGPVMVTGLQCPPNATDFSLCSHNGFGNLCCGCNHSHDLAIRCHDGPVEVPTIPFRKRRNFEGVKRLQYYKDGLWGTVCGAYIGYPEANMICSMMGFKHGGKLVMKYKKKWSYRGLGPIILKYLDCPINATDISQCPFRNYTSHDHRWGCYLYSDHRRDISISCNKKPVRPQVTPVRLKGSNANSGLLEVYHNKSWLIVPSYSGDPKLASVVCRQLGYRSGGEIYKNNTCMYGYCNVTESLSGSTGCTGKEENLGQCEGLQWLPGWPMNGQPIGIRCYVENEKRAH